jgi:hypothetical protein
VAWSWSEFPAQPSGRAGFSTGTKLDPISLNRRAGRFHSDFSSLLRAMRTRITAIAVVRFNAAGVAASTTCIQNLALAMMMSIPQSLLPGIGNCPRDDVPAHVLLSETRSV